MNSSSIDAHCEHLYLNYSYISKKISSNYKLYIIDKNPSVWLNFVVGRIIVEN